MQLFQQLIKPSDHYLLLVHSTEIHVVDPKSLALIATYSSDVQLYGKPVYISKHKQILCAQKAKGIINVWNTDSLKVLAKMSTPETVKELQKSDDEYLLFGSTINNKVLIWLVDSGSLLRQIMSTSGSVIHLSYDHISNNLILVGQTLIELYRLSDLLYSSERQLAMISPGSFIKHADSDFQTLAIAVQGRVIVYNRLLQQIYRVQHNHKLISIAVLNGSVYSLRQGAILIVQKQQIKTLSRISQEPLFLLPYRQQNFLILGSNTGVFKVGQKLIKMADKATYATVVKRVEKIRGNIDSLPILQKYKQKKEAVCVSAKQAERKVQLKEVINFVIHQALRLQELNNKISKESEDFS